MADSKISQLTSGAPAQAGDEYVIARSGSNFKLTLTNIAGNMPATTISAGNLTFSSTGQRITGDMSNATIANRLAFQTSTTNGNTDLQIIPNGTSVTSGIRLNNNSDTTNAGYVRMSLNSTEASISVDRNSVSGTYLPLGFNTGGSERMRIDSSTGNVGIGTASPGTKLDVVVSTNNGLRISDGAVTGVVYASSGPAMVVGTTSNHPTVLYSNNAERMRIDSSGNVGIGTASPAFASGDGLEVQRAADATVRVERTGATASAGEFVASSGLVKIGATSSSPFTFITDNTERMRIDASGNTLFGKTVTDVDTVGSRIDAGRIFASINTQETLYVRNTTAAAYRFYVDSAGTVFATNTTISAISDQRYKENIRDLDTGLDAILALKPRTFDWKEGKGKNIKDDRGFIAQEFEQVFPDLVDNWKDPAPEGEEPYKSVRQDLIPVLVKAIQELSAKVAALEAK